MTSDVLWFSEIGLKDLAVVGGKNASLGEMVRNLSQSGVKVPDGFATTAEAYRQFLAHSDLERAIADRLAGLDVEDVTQLAAKGKEIRELVREAPLPPQLEESIRNTFEQLVDKHGNAADLSSRPAPKPYSPESHRTSCAASDSRKAATSCVRAGPSASASAPARSGS